MFDRDLWREARVESRLLYLAVALNAAIGAAIVVQARLLSRIVATVFLNGTPAGALQRPLTILIGVILTRALLVSLAGGTAGLLAVRIKDSLRRRLLRRLQELGPAFVQAERTGELTNTVGDGVEALDAYFRQYLPQLTIAVVIPLIVLLSVASGDLLSAAILLITAPLIPLFMALVGHGSQKVVQRQWRTLSYMSAHFLDMVQGLTTLRILGQSKAQIAKIARISRQYGEATLRVLRVTFLSALILELVATLSVAIIAVETGLRLLEGGLGFADALFILILAPEFYLPLRMLGARFHAGTNGTAAARRIFSLLEAHGEPAPENPMSGSAPEIHKNHIRFCGVSAAFSGGERPALHDVSFDLQPGKHLAVVGQSGAGKSTLLHLLLGFISPQEGQIFIGDRPLAAVDSSEWLQQIAWMPERPHLFHDTIAANIGLGCPGASKAAIVDAARQADAHEFISELRLGYDTRVGERGARLSQGQAQRVALARAFLKDAPLFILDEPTASIDSGTERIITDAIKRRSPRQTVITITHRLHTVVDADHVLVLHEGRVVRQGPPSRIIAIDATAKWQNAVARKEPHSPLPDGAERRSGAIPNKRIATDTEPDSSVLQSLQPVSATHALKRLISFLSGQWVWVLIAVCLGVMAIGSAMGLMGLSAYLISAAALQPSIAELSVAIVGVRFFGLARGILRYLERLSSHTLTFRLLAELRTWTFAALEPLAPARLSWARSGDLLTRLVSDVTTLEDFYVRALAPPLVALIITTVVTIFLAFFHWQLALAALIILALAGIVLPLIAAAGSRRFAATLVHSRAALNSRLVDVIQGLADLTAYGQAGAFMRRVENAADQLAKVQRGSSWHSAAHEGLTTLLANGAAWLVLFLSIPLVNAGRFDPVFLATVVLTTLAAFEATTPLPQTAQHIENSLQAARRLFAIGTLSPSVAELSPAARPSTTPHLAVRNLSFAYGPDQEPVLRSVDLELPPGKRLAIVGPSGAGKTTLAHLLLRFWDCEDGQIALDGTTVHAYSAGAVRQLFNVLTQDSYLFNASILDNIRLANPEATPDAVIVAAQKAQLHRFIESLPRGYQTMIGERGVQLSGGQRQRLALARAMVRPAPILLLDEPTANLDGGTERDLLETIHALSSSRSLILITHRLVAMDLYDEIIVLHRGRVVERGRHAALLRHGALYSRLWQSQQGAMLAQAVTARSDPAQPPYQILELENAS